MTGMLKSLELVGLPGVTQPLPQPTQVQPPQPQQQPQQLQTPFATPSRSELQSMMDRAGNAGIRVATQDDASAVVRLFAAGHDDNDALADVVWAVKMGGSIPDAVAKVIANRKSVLQLAPQPGGLLPSILTVRSEMAPQDGRNAPDVDL